MCLRERYIYTVESPGVPSGAGDFDDLHVAKRRHFVGYEVPHTHQRAAAITRERENEISKERERKRQGDCEREVRAGVALEEDALERILSLLFLLLVV